MLLSFYTLGWDAEQFWEKNFTNRAPLVKNTPSKQKRKYWLKAEERFNSYFMKNEKDHYFFLNALLF